MSRTCRSSTGRSPGSAGTCSGIQPAGTRGSRRRRCCAAACRRGRGRCRCRTGRVSVLTRRWVPARRAGRRTLKTNASALGWLQRRAAPQWRHRLRQASRKLHQLRRHPTLLGFRTTSSRGTERPACSMVSLGRGKACGPSFLHVRINHTAGTGGGATFTVTETIYCRHGPVLRVDRV